MALFETPAGYAIFKVLDTNILKDVDSIHKHFASPASARQVYVSEGEEMLVGVS